MNVTQNKYYFKALDSFPFYMEETIDALNYALSYDGQDADSLCLLARVYSEVLLDYEQAKLHFNEALQCKVDSVSVPKYYIECLLKNEDFEEAEKLIAFALGIKGIDKAEIYYWKSALYEKQELWKKALEEIKNAERFTYNQEYLDFLEGRRKFIKKKQAKFGAKKKKGAK